MLACGVLQVQHSRAGGGRLHRTLQRDLLHKRGSIHQLRSLNARATAGGLSPQSVVGRFLTGAHLSVQSNHCTSSEMWSLAKQQLSMEQVLDGRVQAVTPTTLAGTLHSTCTSEMRTALHANELARPTKLAMCSTNNRHPATENANTAVNSSHGRRRTQAPALKRCVLAHSVHGLG